MPDQHANDRPEQNADEHAGQDAPGRPQIIMARLGQIVRGGLGDLPAQQREQRWAYEIGTAKPTSRGNRPSS
jgi:hypothetical protein